MRSDNPPVNPGESSSAPSCDEAVATPTECATRYREDAIAAAEKLAGGACNASLARLDAAGASSVNPRSHDARPVKLYAAPSTAASEPTSCDDSRNDSDANMDDNTNAHISAASAECSSTADCDTSAASSNSQDAEAGQASNVINLFTGQTLADYAGARIIRVCAESNGARMLYSTLERPERLVAVPILCWALLEDGSVTGMVPWLDEVLPCEEIEHNFSINWEGYYCSIAEDFFFDPPAEVIAQLSVAARFNNGLLSTASRPVGGAAAAVAEQEDWQIVQEIPDPIGTHALLLNDTSDSLILTSVISWTLDEYGRLHGMLADDACVEKLPVLPGDDCLFCAEDDTSFKCYFQRDIAEQIRTQNPETMEAIEQLFGN